MKPCHVYPACQPHVIELPPPRKEILYVPCCVYPDDPPQLHNDTQVWLAERTAKPDTSFITQSPKDEIGRAFSQAPDSLTETAKVCAWDFISVGRILKESSSTKLKLCDSIIIPQFLLSL